MNTNVRLIFDQTNKDLFYYWPNRPTRKKPYKDVKKIHMGDFVRYGNTHISTVFSPEVNCDARGNNCTYEIIHASGKPYFDLNGNGIKEPNEFSRKVRKNLNTFMSSPKGFGRVKLWD